MTNPNLTSELSIPDPAAAWRPKPPSQSMKENTASDPSGYQRAIVQDGVTRIESGGVQRSSVSEIAASATAAAGVPWLRAEDPRYRCSQSPHEVTEDSILTFPDGSQCTLRQAKQANIIRADNSPFEQGQEQPNEEVHPDLQMDLLADEALDRDYSSLVDTTGGIEQMAAIQQIVENGEIDTSTLGALASQLRVEPGQLEARISPIMQAFEQQARAVMSEGGFDSNDVVAFAQRNHPDKLQQAMSRQATMRQTGGYAELRSMYIEGLAEHNPHAALAADLGNGITQYQDAKGRVMVRIPGMSEMLWKTAIKSFGPR
jgi:hypothetical protein